MSNVEIITATHRAVSRRSFIRGVIASGAAAYSAGYLFRGASAVYAQDGAQGAVERLVSLSINGQQRRVDLMPQDTLAMVLRYKLGLTGTKLGCDRAECGACTVLLDGVPHYSCSILAHSVRGRQVTTIEGLVGPSGELHPVQQAVMDEAGFQCAFCAPGFIMAMVGFLATNDSPTRREAAEGMSGNLCRCCDYDKILDSCLRAADYTREGIPTEVSSNG
jgi:aerobic-type carbon monoxide dehydrogenase small subunit (CoxS/CutS family)